MAKRKKSIGLGIQDVGIQPVLGTGWVHSHGMSRFGLPDLEARDVPDFLMEPAAGLLRDLCDYMIQSGQAIHPGEYVQLSPQTTVTLVQADPEPDDPDHDGIERLRVEGVQTGCEHCAGGDPQDYPPWGK